MPNNNVYENYKVKVNPYVKYMSGNSYARFAVEAKEDITPEQIIDAIKHDKGFLESIIKQIPKPEAVEQSQVMEQQPIVIQEKVVEQVKGKDGASFTDAQIVDGKLILFRDDGTEIVAGEIPKQEFREIIQMSQGRGNVVSGVGVKDNGDALGYGLTELNFTNFNSVTKDNREVTIDGTPNVSVVTGTLPIANGGTGETTANDALNALLPTQTGNSGDFLTTDGSDASWSTITPKLSLDQTTPETISNGIPLLDVDLGDFNTEKQLVNKQYVDSAINFVSDYYFNDNASDIGGIYYQMTDQDLEEPVSTFVTSGLGTGDDQPLVNFATNAGIPGVDKLNKGLYRAHIHAKKSGGTKSVVLYSAIYIRDTGGTETLVGTSSISAALTTTITDYDLIASVPNEVILATTDRIVCKFFANVGSSGSAVDVTLYAEDAYNSALQVPIESNVLSQIYLRQDGTKPLTANWDAGSFDITAQNLTANGDITSPTGSTWTIGDGGAGVGSLYIGVDEVLSSNLGITSLGNISTLDATTETTIENAIDTLPNLTSIQSQSISLSGSLTVEAASTINQDLTTDASPTFAGATLSGFGKASQNNLLFVDSSGVVTDDDNFYYTGNQLYLVSSSDPLGNIRVGTSGGGDAFFQGTDRDGTTGFRVHANSTGYITNDFTFGSSLGGASTLAVSGNMTIGSGIFSSTAAAANGLTVEGTIAGQGDVTVGANLTVTGDLTVNGTTTTLNTQTIEAEDNLILINSGETGAGVTAGTAGIEVDRGTETNYQFMYQESTDSFVIGEIGGLQKVATREDSPTDTGVAFWNNSASRFDTDSNLAWDGSDLTVAGNIQGSSDNSYFGLDTSSPPRVGMTKKAGSFAEFTHGSGAPFVISRSSGTDIGASNTFTDEFVINTSGNVGIGESSPNAPLSFPASFGEKIRLYNSVNFGIGVQSSAFEFITNSATDDFVFGYGSSGSLTELMRIEGSGNVGIGTSSPATNVHLYEASDNPILGLQNGGNAIFGIQCDGNNGIRMGSFAGSDINDYLYVENGGNVGIGISDPQVKLHAYDGNSTETPQAGTGILYETADGGGEAYIGILGKTTQGYLFGDSADARAGQIGYDHTTNIMSFKTAGNTNRMLVNSTGVAIGANPSAPLWALDVQSTAVASATFRRGTADQRIQIWNTNNFNAADQNCNSIVFMHNDSGGTTRTGAYVRHWTLDSGATQGYLSFYSGNGAAEKLRLGSDIRFHLGTGTEIARWSTNGDLFQGTTTGPGGTKGKTMMFGDNGGNPQPGTNTAGIFAKDVSGTVEMFAVDEANNVTQISPHDENGDWVYRSENTKTKKKVEIAMEAFFRDYDKANGTNYYKELSL